MSVQMTRFELLANELLHEIFDYLTPNHLIKTFTNLNKRFSLLISQRFFQLDLSHISKSQYECIIQILPLDQISALKISNKWTINIFSRFSFKPMIHLRMLTLAHVNYHELRCLLTLKDFFFIIQQLKTFKIQSTSFNGLDRDRLVVLQKIFTQMPKLRVCQVPLIDVNDFDDLKPSACLEEFSLDYGTMACLDRLLNYIPNVQSLTVRVYTDLQHFSKQITTKSSSVINSSLKYLQISTINNIPFSQIEDFFQSRFPRLNTLKFFFKTDASSQSCLDYIDDQRWQSLLQSFISLQHFHCCIELPIPFDITLNLFETNEYFRQKNWTFTSEIYTYSFNRILRFHTNPYLKQRLDIIPSKAFAVNNNIYSCVRDLRILIDTIPNDLPKNGSALLYPNVMSLTLISNKSFHEQSFLLYLYSIIDYKHLRYLTVQLDNCSRFFLLSLIEKYSQISSFTLSTYHSWSKLISLSSQLSKRHICSLTVYEIFRDFTPYHSIHQLFHRLQILSICLSSIDDCYRFLTLLFIGSQQTTVEQLRSLTIKCDFDEPDMIANWIRSNILRKLSYKCTTSVLLIWL